MNVSKRSKTMDPGASYGNRSINVELDKQNFSFSKNTPIHSWTFPNRVHRWWILVCHCRRSFSFFLKIEASFTYSISSVDKYRLPSSVPPYWNLRKLTRELSEIDPWFSHVYPWVFHRQSDALLCCAGKEVKRYDFDETECEGMKCLCNHSI